jgi:hypothetical protein
MGHVAEGRDNDSTLGKHMHRDMGMLRPRRLRGDKYAEDGRKSSGEHHECKRK